MTERANSNQRPQPQTTQKPTMPSSASEQVPAEAHGRTPAIPAEHSAADANLAKGKQSRVLQDCTQVRPPPATGTSNSIDAVHRDKTSENVNTVNINDRKVKVGADLISTSLYPLCRRWLRNDVPRKIQPGLQNFAKLLPKPLPRAKVEYDECRPQDGNKDEHGALENFSKGHVETSSDNDLLETHIRHFKNVRKRLREEQKQRIERYKLRLALLLQPSPY